MGFVEEVRKIHYQASVPSAMLMAMKGRVERRDGVIKNRIGSAFPNGDQSVLIFGAAGTGKTICMAKIYKGLALEERASFVESGGMATSIGLLDLITNDSKSIMFIDEMDWDNKEHLSLLKQVANGKIHRQKSGGGVEVEFDGLVIASTNSINVPRGSKSEHLFATLDRFIVVKTEKSDLNQDDVLSNIISGTGLDDKSIDWDLIADRLNSNWDAPLTQGEITMIKRIWKNKSRECLDPSREQFRNMHRVKDCVLFVKRMSQCNDVSKDEKLMKFCVELISNLVITNYGNLVWMDRSKREVFTVIKNAVRPLSPRDIIEHCQSRGSSIERRTLHRKLRDLVDQGFIAYYAYGQYWIRNDYVEERGSCKVRV